MALASNGEIAVVPPRLISLGAAWSMPVIACATGALFHIPKIDVEARDI